MRLIDANRLRKIVRESEWEDKDDGIGFHYLIGKQPIINPLQEVNDELIKYFDGVYAPEGSWIKQIRDAYRDDVLEIVKEVMRKYDEATD